MKFPKLGPTGKFPYGHADATDEGELRMGLATDHANGIVRLHFGKPIAWVGLPAAHARAVGQALLEAAEDLEKRKA